MKNLATLKDAALILKKGSIDQIPSQLVIDLESITREEFWNLIEILRHHRHGHHLISRELELNAIREIMPSLAIQLRNLVSAGNFEEARQLMVGFSEASDPEVLIQKIRVDVFEGRFEEAGLIGQKIVSNPALKPSDRGTVMQLIGHALMELGKLDQSKVYLEAALDHAVFAEDYMGRISAHLFLAKSSALNQDRDLANKHLNACLEILLEKMPNLRWFMAYFRTLAQVMLFTDSNSSDQAVKLQMFTARMARCLKDPLYESRAWIESLIIGGQHLSADERSAFLSKTVSQQNFGSSDLPIWLKAASEGQVEAKACHTLRLMHETARQQKPKAKLQFLSAAQQAEQMKWIYHAPSGILFDFESGSMITLITRSPTEKLLLLLNSASESIDESIAFEQVWGLKWNPERHLSTLKMLISRFNKSSASLKINRTDGLLSVSNPGWVCETEST